MGCSTVFIMVTKINNCQFFYGLVTVPSKELQTGHVHQFQVNQNMMYPLSSAYFMNSTVYVPHNIDGVLTYLWGKDWPNKCQVTYNHRQSRLFYSGKFPGNENVNANKYTKAEFSCHLLPLHFHRGIHFMGKNLTRYST